jgi:hypothetical protein
MLLTLGGICPGLNILIELGNLINWKYCKEKSLSAEKRWPELITHSRKQVFPF